MSLAAQAKMVQDNGLIVRVAAAASRCGVRQANVWAANNMWLLSAQPNWSDIYSEAEDQREDSNLSEAEWFGVVGKNPNVITDEMISEAVNVVLAGIQDPSNPVSLPSPLPPTPDPTVFPEFETRPFPS